MPSLNIDDCDAQCTSFATTATHPVSSTNCSSRATSTDCLSVCTEDTPRDRTAVASEDPQVFKNEVPHNSLTRSSAAEHLESERDESTLYVPEVDDRNKPICAYWGKIGDWEIGKALGAGSFSKVLVAKNQRSGCSEVVKAILKRNVSSKDGWQNVCSEHRSLAKVGTHPNIACLTGGLQSSKYVYFFLEHAAGQELFGCLTHWRANKYSPMPMEGIARIFSSVSSALAHCHQLDICHRDVKPENIMVQDDFTAKLVDFGFACPRARLQTQCVGSMPFIAPEFISCTAKDGAPGDVWSLGVVLIEMLYGGYAFSASFGWDSKKEIPLAKCGAQLLEAFDDPKAGLTRMRKALDVSDPFVGDDMLSSMLCADAERRLRAEELCEAVWLEEYMKV